VDRPEGVIKGNIYAMAQMPDGYLWLGTEFGLFRFDGVRSIPGNHLRGSISLMFDQVEEWTNFILPQGEWTAG
jgi:ligand-binding sensor domain-containing protein